MTEIYSTTEVLSQRADVVTGGIRYGTPYSTRPAVWPGVVPLGGGPLSFGLPTMVGVPTAAWAAATPYDFGDVTLSNAWTYLMDTVTQYGDEMFAQANAILASGETGNIGEQTPSSLVGPSEYQPLRQQNLPWGWDWARNQEVLIGGWGITVSGNTIHADIVNPLTWSDVGNASQITLNYTSPLTEVGGILTLSCGNGTDIVGTDLVAVVDTDRGINVDNDGIYIPLDAGGGLIYGQAIYAGGQTKGVIRLWTQLVTGDTLMVASPDGDGVSQWSIFDTGGTLGLVSASDGAGGFVTCLGLV